MAAAGASLIAYLTTSLAVIIAYHLFFFRNPQSKYHFVTTPTYLRPALTALVLFHTLYILYKIILDSPTNLFTALDLPLSYQTDSIRSLLLMFSDDPASGLPSGIERVLTRLGSANMRLLYVRFGHEALAACEYCTSWSDFGLYVVPGALWEYVREVMLIGALTLRGTRHPQYRTVGVGVLCAAAFLEAYVVLTTEISIPTEYETPSSLSKIVERLFGGHGVLMLHDVSILARRVLFLILPMVIHFILKASPLPLSPSTLLNPISANQTAQLTPESVAFRTLQSLTTKLQLLRLTRGAILRNSALKADAQAYWTTERQEGEWIRADGDVRRRARALDLGFDEATSVNDTDRGQAANGSPEDGPLLKHAKSALQNLFAQGFVPSPFWKPPPSDA